jgi:uncharacterized protein YeaO (DUF488 family)
MEPMRADSAGTLQQASIYDVLATGREARAGFGLLVLVMRRWPRGLSWADINLWLPDAGPSRQLLQDYHVGGLHWGAFLQRYRGEQLADWRHAGYYKTGKGKAGEHAATMSPLQHIRQLLVEYEIVTLLCHERDAQCHRYELLKLVQEAQERGRPAPPASVQN